MAPSAAGALLRRIELAAAGELADDVGLVHRRAQPRHPHLLQHHRPQLLPSMELAGLHPPVREGRVVGGEQHRVELRAVGAGQRRVHRRGVLAEREDGGGQRGGRVGDAGRRRHGEAVLPRRDDVVVVSAGPGEAVAVARRGGAHHRVQGLQALPRVPALRPAAHQRHLRRRPRRNPAGAQRPPRAAQGHGSRHHLPLGRHQRRRRRHATMTNSLHRSFLVFSLILMIISQNSIFNFKFEVDFKFFHRNLFISFCF